MGCTVGGAQMNRCRCRRRWRRCRLIRSHGVGDMAGRGGCCLPKTVLGSGFILFVVGVKNTTLAAIAVMEAVAIAALVAAAIAIPTTAAGLLVEVAVLGKVLGLATILPVAWVDARAKGSVARMEVTVSGAVVRVVAVMKTLATMPYGGSCRGAGRVGGVGIRGMGRGWRGAALPSVVHA